jgi:hypothetical protein
LGITATECQRSFSPSSKRAPKQARRVPRRSADMDSKGRGVKRGFIGNIATAYAVRLLPKDLDSNAAGEMT